MPYQKSVLRLALLAFVVAGTGLFCFAQDPSKSQDPMDKPRNVKPELKKAYKDWLEKDVTYVITDEERKAFKKLATDDERERFIEEFWRRRDPDPDTDENEFKEEYYERIAYANEHFASGMPGWKSDRGRIWIMYGKPDERETHPMGGNYDRPSYEGGGSTTTYPFEIWFYRYLAGVGSGVEIEFVDPTGSGEYRIARNPNEKDALLMIPGAGLTLSEQLGLSDKSDRISGYGGINNNYQREQDSPFSRLQLLADLSRPPQVKFNDLASAVNTGVIERTRFNFDVRVDFFRQSDERVIDGVLLFRWRIRIWSSRIVADCSRLASASSVGSLGGGPARRHFEDPVITTATTQELSEARIASRLIKKRWPSRPELTKSM